MKNLYFFTILIIAAVFIYGCGPTELRWKRGASVSTGDVTDIAWEHNSVPDQTWDDTLAISGDTTTFKEVDELVGQGACLAGGAPAILEIDGEQTFTLNEGSSETLEFDDAL